MKLIMAIAAICSIQGPGKSYSGNIYSDQRDCQRAIASCVERELMGRVASNENNQEKALLMCLQKKEF